MKLSVTLETDYFVVSPRNDKKETKMATYTNDILFIQALDSYSYDIEQCIEKLQYVLGGNDHAGANNLMGRIYHEQLHDYKNAREYFYSTIMGRSETTMDSYWLRIIFEGKIEPPKRTESIDKLLSSISTTPGAIGFIDKKWVNNSVKELKVIK